MPYSTIAREIAIPAIGAIFGGSGRSDKRQSRQQYRDALIGAGVRYSLVQPWHSDEHSAGQTLIQIAQQPKGVEFLNAYMPSRISRNSVQSLPNQYQTWITNKNASQNTGGSGSSGSGASAPASEVAKVVPMLAGLGGLLYWGLK